MHGLRQFAGAFLLAFLSVLLVFGSLSLSLSEIYNLAPSESSTVFPATPVPLTATSTLPIPINSPTVTNTPFPSSTPLPAPSCPQPPSGWVSVRVQPGDNVYTVAARYNTTAIQLRAANCLVTDSLVQGSSIFVPPAPTSTSVHCGPFPGWVKTYIVRHGDTLFSIAQSYGISLASLKLANCKDDRNLIFTGEMLWVPNIPTRTPTITVTSMPDYFTAFPTDPLTETSLPYTATTMPTNTPSPSSTPTPLPTLTSSPTPFN